MARNKGKQSEGKYAPMPYGVIKSPAWRSLSGAAVKVWFELHTRYKVGKNGEIHLSMNEAAEALGIGKGTVQRAFKDVEEKGFIAFETKRSWYPRRAHEWRLATKPMQPFKGREMPADNWRRW